MSGGAAAVSEPAQRVVAAFTEAFAGEPDGSWWAPGRVNLIGEHTDYNDGFVLPFALPHRIAVAAAPREDGRLRVTTIGDDGQPQRADPVAIDSLAPGHVSGWAAYPCGVAWVLRETMPEAVTSGATRFLLVVLERLRRAGVHDEPHVRSIDAHAERHGGDDNVDVFVEELVLMTMPHLVVETGMVRDGAHAFAGEPAGQRVHFAP